MCDQKALATGLLAAGSLALFATGVGAPAGAAVAGTAAGTAAGAGAATAAGAAGTAAVGAGTAATAAGSNTFLQSILASKLLVPALVGAGAYQGKATADTQAKAAKQTALEQKRLTLDAQRPKQPNIAKLIGANRNALGKSATSLSGSGGVAPSSLLLGSSTLLGQ